MILFILSGFAGYYWYEEEGQGQTGSSFICTTCNRSYSSKAALVNHQQSHEGRTNCNFCGNTFSSISNLNKHVKKNHPENVHQGY